MNPEETHKEQIQADPSIEAMTREEAMEYFQLPAWAKREDLDKQFWKLGKIYKAQKDEQKLADISAAYAIATGERDRKREEKKEEETAKHYFGKTKKQWAEFWHYEWWKFAIAAAALIMITSVISYFFMEPKTDFRVASIGHFSQDTEMLADYMKENYGFKNPDVDFANVVSDNNEGEEVEPYAASKATSLIAVRPDILVMDAMTAPAYVMGENMMNLDDVYAQMLATWSEESLSHIEPYMYSKARFYEEYADTLPQEYRDDLDALTPEDEIEHVYGFIIRDEIDRLSLGYTVKWKESDPCIIISVNLASGQVDKAKEIMQKLLLDIPTFRAAYLETHPYAEATD
ncbi:MAG: hypothetical protein J5750_04025 [Clostridiales bacterium]|nr:hypothetical protein [Clostridiales bacterium]